jgi:hypothetical protein
MRTKVAGNTFVDAGCSLTKVPSDDPCTRTSPYHCFVYRGASVVELEDVVRLHIAVGYRSSSLTKGQRNASLYSRNNQAHRSTKAGQLQIIEEARLAWPVATKYGQRSLIEMTMGG